MITTYFSHAKAPRLKAIPKYRAGSWVHVVAPDQAELEQLAKDHQLDIDLLADGMDLYEVPRIERDGDVVYVYTRYYHADNGVINATEPLLIVVKPSCLITVLRIDSPILESLIANREEVITTQKTKTLLEMLEAVNGSYQQYVTSTTRHILSVRAQLKKTDIESKVLLGLVEIEDDLNEFLSALQPQSVMLRNLLGGRYLRLFEEDKDLIEDLSLGAGELIELVKSRLKTIVNIRQAYDAIAASELNRTFRRLTSISIFLMIPTIVSGLYGMNVTLPLSHHGLAFWYVVAFVLAASSMVVYVFRRNRWL